LSSARFEMPTPRVMRSGRGVHRPSLMIVVGLRRRDGNEWDAQPLAQIIHGGDAK
jgi:hypothetical protein